MSEQQSPASALGAASALDAQRPRYTFEIPEGVRAWPTDPKVIVLREITVGEEQQASEIAQGKGLRYVFEAVKHSLLEADGKPITWDAGGKERFFEACNPRVRALIIKAYDRLHLPSDPEAADFLATMKVTV